MKLNKFYLLIVAIVVALAWPVSHLISQMRATTPVQLKDHWITLTEATIDPDTSQSRETATHTFAALQSRKLLFIRTPTSQDNVDRSRHILDDIPAKTTTQWYANVAMKSTTSIGDGSTANAELWWTERECNTIAEGKLGKNITATKLPTIYVQPGNILAYGTELSYPYCCNDPVEINPVLLQTETIYRSPEFGCRVIQQVDTDTHKDGTVHVFHTVMVSSHQDGVYPYFGGPPAGSIEVPQNRQLQAMLASAGVTWPSTPFEQQVYRKQEEVYKTKRADK